jgi:peroxiredoxin (alkyl hydroperoxide reductase subunit C)
LAGAQVLGISTDSKFSHLAWVHQELGELRFPLLADFTKKVSREYGVLLERLGAALRGTFIIDPDGLVRAYGVQDLTVGRNVDEILRLVSALKTGELCPVGWRSGEPFLPPIPKNTGE